MRKSVRDFVQSPTTQMMGLYIAAQHVAPAALGYVSKELTHRNHKQAAALVTDWGIPIIKIAGYGYNIQMGQKRLDDRFRELSTKRA